MKIFYLLNFIKCYNDKARFFQSNDCLNTTCIIYRSKAPEAALTRLPFSLEPMLKVLMIALQLKKRFDLLIAPTFVDHLPYLELQLVLAAWCSGFRKCPWLF